MEPPVSLIDASFVPVVSPSVSSVDLDGETVLYNDATGSLHALNTTATIIWACCDGCGSVGEIASDVSEEFGIDREQVLADVIDTLNGFARLGLLAGFPVAPD